MLLPDTISIVEEQNENGFRWVVYENADALWKEWWNKVVRERNNRDRKGKKFTSYSSGDYGNFKEGIWRGWLKVEKQRGQRVEGEDSEEVS